MFCINTKCPGQKCGLVCVLWDFLMLVLGCFLGEVVGSFICLFVCLFFGFGVLLISWSGVGGIIFLPGCYILL